jgi:hypothetical protein
MARRRHAAAAVLSLSRTLLWGRPWQRFSFLAMRLRIRVLSSRCKKALPKTSLQKMEGGEAPKGATPQAAPAGAARATLSECCHSPGASGALAFRRSTAGSLWRINAAAQLQPRFLGSASSGVTRIFPYPSPASSSQAGHCYRPGGVRSRPGAGVWPARGHCTRSTFESTLAKGPSVNEMARM